MKTLVIIRTCQKDDWIAYRCYNSFRSVMICDFIFFAEEGSYRYINQSLENSSIIYHKGYGNYGGQLGLYGCIENLKSLNVSGYDKIILSDSDITVIVNPLLQDFDFGGIKSSTNDRHYSGQLLIYSKWLWKKVMNYDKYDELIKSFVDSGTIDVADDTCMSWVATEYAKNVFDFSGLDYWKHEKLYHLEPTEK